MKNVQNWISQKATSNQDSQLMSPKIWNVFCENIATQFSSEPPLPLFGSLTVHGIEERGSWLVKLSHTPSSDWSVPSTIALFNPRSENLGRSQKFKLRFYMDENLVKVYLEWGNWIEIQILLHFQQLPGNFRLDKQTPRRLVEVEWVESNSEYDHCRYCFYIC